MIENTFEPKDLLAIKDIAKRRYTMSELATAFGISPVKLASRLNKGCPLNAALMIPNDLYIDAVIENPDGTLHYDVYRPVLCGTVEDIFEYASQERFH